MSTTSKDNHALNADTITSGNNTIITFREPVQRLWIGCDPTSVAYLRVTVTNVNPPHIHGEGEYIIIEPSGYLEFEADPKNKIESVTLAPHTAATVTYTHTVLKV